MEEEKQTNVGVCCSLTKPGISYCFGGVAIKMKIKKTESVLVFALATINHVPLVAAVLQRVNISCCSIEKRMAH